MAFTFRPQLKDWSFGSDLKTGRYRETNKFNSNWENDDVYQGYEPIDWDTIPK